MSLKRRAILLAKLSMTASTKRVLDALNRADEIGGEVRDIILARTNSPFFRRIAERLAAVRGSLEVPDTANDEERARHEAATEAAPPPTAAQIQQEKRRDGLGDPEVEAQIYGRTSCPWTGRAITLLKTNKTDYDYIDLDDSEFAALEGKLVAETKQATVPYIFLRGEFIGGFNALNEIVRLGQLELRTMSAQARAVANVAEVEITPRAEA